MPRKLCYMFFFFNDTATTEIYTLSLHDALPILTCQLSCLAFWDHEMKTTHCPMEFWKQIRNHLSASYEFYEINWVKNPAYHHDWGFTLFDCKDLKWSGLSVAFSDTDLMLQFCLPYARVWLYSLAPTIYPIGEIKIASQFPLLWNHEETCSLMSKYLILVD